MIVDFHTHIFPDKIAPKTIKYLAEVSRTTPFTDGTLSGLQASMKEAGVDISVVLPVVTNPKQFDSINRFACEVSKLPGIISFGGIHPASENRKEEIDEIVKMGLPGIKLHPDYQNAFVDEQETIELTQYAISKGLHVVFHGGVDVGFPNPVHCTPERARNMLDALTQKEGYGKIIIAHTGGHELWDDAEKHLVGQDVLFDLAFNLGKIPDEQLRNIVSLHGADKILFATDSPWDSQKQDVEYLKNMTIFTEEEKKAIFSENACRLLGINGGKQ